MRIWLKNIRVNAGLTMAQAAEQLDLKESYYCRIENGERLKKMSISLAKKISDVFGVDLSEIERLERQEETT